MIFILRGPSCVGKDMFAAQYFKNHCVLSSDKFRMMLFDDTSKQNSSEMIFDMMKDTLEKRLRFGTGYTVINSTNLKFAECADYIALAKKFKRKVKFISFDPPEVEVLAERYKQRCLQTGTSEEVVDFEKQCQRYHTLMPRFFEVATDDPQAVAIVRVNQDWEIVQ